MLFFLAIVISLVLIYLTGVSPYVYGGDNADIILAAWFGGVAHPPGYPLNSIIGWVFTHLPYESTVAFKANIMAAVFQALTIGFLFLSLRKITNNVVVSLSASLILAFNPLFWLYAHTLEVFQLNVLLVAISFYLLLLWQGISNKGRKYRLYYLKFAIFFWGLATFHHHTSILLAPAYLYLIKVSNQKIFSLKGALKLFPYFMLGIIPYIYTPIAAYLKTPINWDNPVNLANFIQLITRADYGTFVAAGFLSGSSVGQKFALVMNYFIFLKNDFLDLGILLIIIGGVYMFLKVRKIFFFTLLSAFLIGPFFIFYSGFPTDGNFFTGLWERFLLGSYFFITVFIAFGLLVLHERAIVPLAMKIKSKKYPQKFIVILLSLPILVIPFYMYLVNISKTDLSEFKLGDMLAHDIVASAEPNAIIFLFSDSVLFNSEYYMHTNENIENVKIIKGASTQLIYYREQISREFEDIQLPDGFLEDDEMSLIYLKNLIIKNAGNFPIYSGSIKIEVPGYKWIRSGLLFQLIPEDEEIDGEKLDQLNRDKISRFEYQDINKNIGYTRFIDSHLMDPYYLSSLNIAEHLIDLGDYERAQYYLKRAKTLFPDRPRTYNLLGFTNLLRNECDLALNNMSESIRLNNEDPSVYELYIIISKSCNVDDEDIIALEQRLNALEQQDDIFNNF